MSNLTVMVIGGGGREHSLCWKIKESPLVSKVLCAPGNGGTDLEEKVENLPIGVDRFEELAEAALARKVDLVVVGPDNPLADGIVDFLENKGLSVFGPVKESARLESSKAHAKKVMTDLKIPTAKYGVFENKKEALEFAQANDWARVVKADGLAYGKGVFVCSSIDEVEEALNECFAKRSFGESGDKVILEEKLIGEELSIFLLSDGKHLLNMAPCQDHKRRYEGDKGPNTGGMGAYSPVPLYEKFKNEIEEQIVNRLAVALKDGKLSYRGVLFIGILVSQSTPYVLEFNARFGDPEAQTLMPRLNSDLVPALIACSKRNGSGNLDKISLEWDKRYSMCVVASNDGYPAQSSKDKVIEIGSTSGDCHIFHAGTKHVQEQILTNGGRVISVTGLGDSLDEAAEAAYRNIKQIKFEGMDYRKDIGWRVISRCQSI